VKATVVKNFYTELWQNKGGENEKVLMMQKQHLLMKKVIQIFWSVIYCIANLRKNNLSKLNMY